MLNKNQLRSFEVANNKILNAMIGQNELRIDITHLVTKETLILFVMNFNTLHLDFVAIGHATGDRIAVEVIRKTAM